MSGYEYGKTARLYFHLRDPATGDPVAGTNVVCTVTAPDDTTATPTVSNPATGDYYCDIALDQAGTWRYLFTCESPQTADEGVLTVDARYSTPDWLPGPQQVGAYVPALTIEEGDVTGSPTGTFTALTFPTADQVDQYVKEAAAYVEGVLGTITAGQEAVVATIVALRAAAAAASAQPEDSRNQVLIDTLTTQAATLLQVVATTATVPGGESRAAPVWQFPEPVLWGDVML